MKLLFKLAAKLTGRNLKSTPKEVIIDQMTEPRALPMGKKEFEEWSDRIISGALIPGGESDPEGFRNSQKFALANLLLHLGPTESHKPDAFFIHSLRKVAVNQVADYVRTEIREERKAREEAKKAEEASIEAGIEALKRADSSHTQVNVN